MGILNTSRTWGEGCLLRAVLKSDEAMCVTLLAWHTVLAEVSPYEVIAALPVGGPSSPAISLL